MAFQDHLKKIVLSRGLNTDFPNDWQELCYWTKKAFGNQVVIYKNCKPTVLINYSILMSFFCIPLCFNPMVEWNTRGRSCLLHLQLQFEQVGGWVILPPPILFLLTLSYLTAPSSFHTLQNTQAQSFSSDMKRCLLKNKNPSISKILTPDLDTNYFISDFGHGSCDRSSAREHS